MERESDEFDPEDEHTAPREKARLPGRHALEQELASSAPTPDLKVETWDRRIASETPPKRSLKERLSSLVKKNR